MTPAVIKRSDKRIGICKARIVFYVSVDLIAQTDVEREIPLDAPVVLPEKRKIIVVDVRKIKVLIWQPASQRHGEKQIVIVYSAVVVVIEIGEILDKLDTSLAKTPNEMLESIR